MRRYVVGTAGHVDHGKTALVRALTGVDTDRLPEEKRRGISIELGFAPLDLGGGARASVIDVPGHRRLVRAMIAGAIGIELVLLVVAADEGVMAQTREHVAVCDLLGIRRAVVAVTKCDLVDASLAELAGEEARALLGTQWRAEVVACSAKTGQGVERVREALARALAELAAPPERKHARLGVDRVFTVRGVGTVVTGTLVEGSVAVGDALYVVGREKVIETAARGLHVHDAAVERASAPTRLAVSLAGVPLDAVKRGDVVTSDARLRATRVVDVVLREAGALKRGVSVTAHVGTASTSARVDALQATDAGRVARLTLEQPLVVVGGDRVVLRGSNVDAAAGAVLGGGVVIDARPERKMAREARHAVGEALASGDARRAMEALVAAAAPRPIAREAIARRFAIDEDALAAEGNRLAKSGEVVKLGDRGWVDAAALEALVMRARALVSEHHRAFPLDRGMPVETLRERLASAAGRDAAEEAIVRARVKRSPGDDAIAVDGDVARMAGGAASANADLAKRVESARTAIEAAEVHGATEHAVVEATGAKPAEARAILAKLAREGIVVHAGDLWFATRVVDDAQRRLVDHFSGARRLTVIEFKQLSGLARKQAILLLEHFDRVGLTRRDGDARVLR
jgi:selenocysteine-specific elongation factor